MRINTNKHEDERRVMTEWISNTPFKRCKVLETKTKCFLGKHYHNNSDSMFYMLRGKGIVVLKPSNEARFSRDWMFEGDCIFVPRGIIHTFELFPNTILLEASSEPYDKQDEIQVVD